MKYIAGDLSQLPPSDESVALTLGNFDGVHCGHQYLIGNLKKQAEKRSLKSAVLCFSPHPARILGDKKFSPLSTLEDKRAQMDSLGVDLLAVQDFDQNFSKVSAEDFLRQYLSHFFNIQFLSVGYDFRFGKEGRGDFEMIQNFFKEKGVEVFKDEPFAMDSHLPSSTKIREALKNGDVEQANRFLGRQYELQGRVVTGEAKGRTIGFPTANLEEIKCLIPGRGVYVIEVLVESQSYLSVCNIGVRPTLNGEKESFEVHILDFDQDLYGQTIRVRFLSKIRDEKKFENFDTLKEQISKDVQFARDFKG